MSRKRLSRTVIEGGRYTGNKYDRRQSHRTERANERAYIADLLKDLDNAEEISVEPKEHVSKGFRDKLSPMYRWLHAQVGRVWNDVKSEVFQTFDTRTTAGRHITYDHLLNAVEEVPDLKYRNKYSGPYDITSAYWKNEFYVDEDGILRAKTRISRKDRSPPYFDTRQIANWLSGRIVGMVGKKLYWFVPADKNEKRGGYRREWIVEWDRYNYRYNGPVFRYHNYRPIYKYDTEGKIALDENGNKIVREYEETWPYAAPTAFRQDRKLNEKELAFWDTIPEWYQTKVLERSPTYPNPPKNNPYSYLYY